MAVERERVTSKTFFLNETHELSRGENSGGGPPPRYVGISWASKGRALSQSLSQAMASVKRGRDPLRDERFFILAQPVPQVEKISKDKKKAPSGTAIDVTDFGGSHGRIFDRLGLDLLQVADDGSAVVHGARQTVDQLIQRASTLEDLGPREQSRWVTLDSFNLIPLQLRYDADWLKSFHVTKPAEVIIELQPVLSRVEADQVLRVIAAMLDSAADEKLTGSGTDYSGRFWFRGRASQRTVRAIAKDFYSVQSIHTPLRSIAAAKSKSGGGSSSQTNITQLLMLMHSLVLPFLIWACLPIINF